MSEKIRIGFVGVGGMGQCAHLRNYATMGDCEVVAIAEIRPELGQRVAQKYLVPKVGVLHDRRLAGELSGLL